MHDPRTSLLSTRSDSPGPEFESRLLVAGHAHPGPSPPLTPAVITPLDLHMGLDAARSLSRRGVPVYALDPDPRTPGASSKFVQFVRCPDWSESPDEYIGHLASFGARLGQKAVLIPVRENLIRIISAARHELKEWFVFALPDHHLMERILEKNRLGELALQHRIDAPRTFIPGDVGEVEHLSATLEYPVVLKPTERLHWFRPEIVHIVRRRKLDGKPKLVVCESPEELIGWYRRIAPLDDRLIVQELIPGEEDRLFYLSGYWNRHSELVSFYVGQKVRTLPVGFGAASAIRTVKQPAVQALAQNFLCGMGYQGPAGIEFKLDPRDNRYKLIEINPRLSMFDSLGTACGVDVPWIIYCDLLGIPIQAGPGYELGLLWVDLQRDLRAFLGKRRAGQLTLRGWLRSLSGRRIIATYSSDDPRPFLNEALSLMKNMLFSRQAGSGDLDR